MIYLILSYIYKITIMLLINERKTMITIEEIKEECNTVMYYIFKTNANNKVRKIGEYSPQEFHNLMQTVLDVDGSFSNMFYDKDLDN